ncbi:MAG: T9SS type A sorting domain-containing protein [Bacteroidetes bacterium]|nr:MAG: T9SS type A sorting domain-containing protein [Bacteroidota bacterium]
MKRHLLYLLAAFTLSSLPSQAQNLLKQIGLPEQASASYGKRQFSLADSGYFYHWNNNQWELYNIQEYVYNSLSQKSKTFEKSPTTRQVINEANYSYHSSGKIQLIYTETYSNGNWEPLLEEKSVYDAKNNRTSYLVRQYNLNLQEWNIVYGDSFEFTYGTNDRIESYILYQQTQNGVIPYQRLTWSDFDANDIPHTLEVESDNHGFSKFIKLDQMQWRDGYDHAQFDPSLYYGYSWNGFDWIPAAYDSSIYVDDNRVKKILFNWNGFTLDTASRVDYRYDAKDHRIETVSYQRVGNGWSLQDGSQDSIVYGFDDVTLERYYNYFDKNTNTWAQQQKEVYYFNKLGIERKQAQLLQFYPNPAQTSIRITSEPAEVSVISLDGRVSVLKQNADASWDVTSLKKGIYLLQAKDQQGIRIARLQVQ